MTTGDTPDLAYRGTQGAASGAMEDAPAPTAEALRRRFRGREAAIRHLGLFAITVGLSASAYAAQLALEYGDPARRFGVLYLVLVGYGAALLPIGLAGLTLRPWSRLPLKLFSGVLCLGFPIGSAIGVYFLYLLGSPEGRYMFSPGYAAVRRDAPHVSLGFSPVLVLIALYVLGVAGFVLTDTFR